MVAQDQTRLWDLREEAEVVKIYAGILNRAKTPAEGMIEVLKHASTFPSNAATDRVVAKIVPDTYGIMRQLLQTIDAELLNSIQKLKGDGNG